MKNGGAPKPPSGYYVYTLAEPNTDEHGSSQVFYVGKGCGGRIAQHEKDARKGIKSKRCDRIRQIWAAGKQVERRIVFETQDEMEAYKYEIYLIERIGRKNLTNGMAGGPMCFEMLDRPLRSGRITDITDAEYYVFLLHKSLDETARKKAMERWQETRLSHFEDMLRRARHNQRLNGWDTSAEIAHCQEEIVKLRIALRCIFQEKMF